jgi:hypothetical protein
MREALRELSVVHPLGKLNGEPRSYLWNESRDPGYIADLGCCRGLLFAGIAEVVLITCGILLWNITSL